MNTDDYHNAAIGIIGADRMSLGLPIVPSKKYGDMEKVRELTEQRDRLAEAITSIASGAVYEARCIEIAREALQSLTNQNEL